MATSPSSIICTLSQFLQDDYDYIIVGGGTAGLVLASRLSEDPNVRVGVLEAGKAHLEDPNIASPVGMAQILNNSDYDWCFQSIPQTTNNNKVHHVARGKGLGGSSCINFLAYCRPSRHDIDNWERLGNKDWNWERLEPYYRKSQRVAQGGLAIRGTQESFALCPEYHGDGPIATSFPPWKFPFEERLLHAFDEMSGMPRPLDPCSGDHLGFYGTLSTIDRSSGATRCDAATGYLHGSMERSNLKILPNALACRILLSDELVVPTIARGVVFSCEGQMHRVHANREIVVACGSIKSPQLLELSGIGNPVEIQAAGVPLRVTLPDVGNNLQEHPLSSVTYELSPESQTLDSLFSDPSLFGEFMSLYMTAGDGPMGGCMSLTGFLPYTSCADESQLEASFESVTSSTESDALKAEMLRNSRSASVQFTCVPANFSPQSGHENLSRVMPGAPAGRGPSDPFADPRIDLGLFHENPDLDVLAAGVVFADRVFRSHQVVDQVVQRISPPASLNMDEPEQVRMYVKDQVLIFNHLLGTCALGKVVDDRLRVKGVRCLRVVDASVIPIQMSGNIIATVYAIAERAAEMIKHDANFA